MDSMIKSADQNDYIIDSLNNNNNEKGLSSTSAIASKNNSLKENNLLYMQVKLLELQDVRNNSPSSKRNSIEEALLSDSDNSDVFSGGEENDFFLKERRGKLASERQKNLAQLHDTLDNLEKAERYDMLEAIDSTLKRLQERTSHISESLDNVQKKQTRVQVEIKDNIDIVKEMRLKAQQLLKRQEALSKNYRNVELHLNNTKPGDYKSAYTPLKTTTVSSSGNNYYSDDSDDDYEVSRPKITTKKTTKYSDEDYSDEELPETKNEPKDDFYSDEDAVPEKKDAKKYSDEDDYYSDDEPPKKSTTKVEDDYYSDEEQDKKTVPKDDYYSDEETPKEQNREEADVEIQISTEEEERKREEEEFEAEERAMEEEKTTVTENTDDADEYDEELARRLAEEHILKLQEEGDE